jgi:hypothetical protein
VTTLASWNSLKFPIRDCIRRLIRTTTRQAHSQDEEKGDGRKIRRDRDMQGEDEGDRSGGLARTSQAESMGEAAIVARRRRTRWQGTEGGKNLSCCCIVSGWPPLELSSAPPLVCPLGHGTRRRTRCVHVCGVFRSLRPIPFPFFSFTATTKKTFSFVHPSPIN